MSDKVQSQMAKFYQEIQNSLGDKVPFRFQSTREGAVFSVFENRLPSSTVNHLNKISQKLPPDGVLITFECGIVKINSSNGVQAPEIIANFPTSYLAVK